MKKKLVFFALLTVLLAFSFLSCQEADEGDEKTIVVTDIPSTTGYNYGYIGLSQDDEVVAISMPVPTSTL